MAPVTSLGGQSVAGEGCRCCVQTGSQVRGWILPAECDQGQKGASCPPPSAAKIRQKGRRNFTVQNAMALALAGEARDSLVLCLWRGINKNNKMHMHRVGHTLFFFVQQYTKQRTVKLTA